MAISMNAGSFDNTSPLLGVNTLDQLIGLASANNLLLTQISPHQVGVFTKSGRALGVFNHNEGLMRSRMIGIQIIKRFTGSGDTWNVAVFVDNKPEINFPFDYPITLSEALTFIAAHHRLEGGKWDIGGAAQPESL
jgi:hypothetical protein